MGSWRLFVVIGVAHGWAPLPAPRWSQSLRRAVQEPTEGMVSSETTYFLDSSSLEACSVDEESSERCLSSLSAKVQEKLLAATLDIQVPGPGAAREGVLFEACAPERALRINLDLLNYRAKRAQKRGEASTARRLWQQCLEIDRLDGRAWLALSRDAERELRDPQLASRYLTEGLYHDPTNAHVRQAYGVFLERQGLRRQALEQLERAIRHDPAHAASYVAKARLVERRCRRRPSEGVCFATNTPRQAQAYNEARKCYALALAAEPDNERALVASALFEFGSGRTEAARTLFDRAVRANPRNAAAYAAWAKMEESARPDEARRLYAAAHAAHASNTRAMTAWAKFELGRGNASAALDLLRKATRVRSGKGGYRGGCVDAEVFATLGLVSWRHCRDVRAARSAFRRAVAVDAADHRAYRSWAHVETRLGNLDLARDILQQGIWGCTTGVSDARKLAELWRDKAKVEAVHLKVAGFNATTVDAARQAFRRALDLATQANDLSADAFAADVYLDWHDLEKKLPPRLGLARKVLEDALATLPDDARLRQALQDFSSSSAPRPAHRGRPGTAPPT